ncbi:MAG: cyclic nucleotide-binding domain-containing protein [Nevskiaceae bacterium]|jgi:CRP-like cAMP-binding protein|nr:cyclic nucleotide-binding domain-containing protein [Nevskiaceae bacterium]
MSDERPVDWKLLAQFSPLDGMKQENQISLARKMALHKLDPGTLLFREGDQARNTIWLVSGAVSLSEGNQVSGMVTAGTPDARNPIAFKNAPPRSCRAIDEVEYLSIDSELLDMILTWDQTGVYEVTELRSAPPDDWMSTLLQSRAMQRIPPTNLQAIFMRMQRTPMRAGDVVIRQGDEGDYFYAIVSGKCAVTRETPLSKDGIRLAELTVGDIFGEDALISESKRNASVTMLTDGILMRLNKQDFRELLNEPVLRWVNAEQARTLVAQGGRWLDVRLPSEFQNSAVDDAINIPLVFIRLKLNLLQKDTPYVVYCDTGRRSSAAAFILVEKGFNAYVLRGGVSSLNG